MLGWVNFGNKKANGAIFHTVLYSIEAFQRKENPACVSLLIFGKAPLRLLVSWRFSIFPYRAESEN